MKPDYIFQCRKCGHLLYVDKEKFYKNCKLQDCPECGEEEYENWIFIDEGNFDKDKEC